MYVASLVLVELLQAALGISLLNRLRNYFLVGYFADLSLMMRRYISRTNAVVLQISEVSSINC